MKPLLKNHDLFPPPGGWGVTITIKGETFNFLQGRPNKIVRDVFNLAHANGVMSTIEDAWDYCNEIWCARDPGRCPKDMSTPTQSREGAPKRTVSKTHMIVSPKGYGHRVWGWLNTFGMRGNFVKEDWMAAINRVTRMLDPGFNRATGCSECSSEWRQIMRQSNPSNVNSSQDAAKWVFDAHNRVNRKLGKKVRDWSTMVIENSWDIELG